MKRLALPLILLFSIALPGIDRPPLLSPVPGSPYRTSSFGEYRYTHFHGGVDYSTNGQEGYPVAAVADGKVSRIKREAGGYGRALYLDLKDGRTAVYGHLIRFSRALGIEQRLKAECEKQGTSFPGDIFFDPPVEVRAGETVAYSGQLGIGSPHLHLEIRRGDLLLDPFSQGVPLPEYSTPSINSIYFVPRKPGAVVNGSFLPLKASFSQEGGGSYKLREGVAIGGDADIFIDVSDNMGSATYKTMPTSITASADGVEFFSMDLEGISLAHYKESMYLFEPFNGSGQLILLRARPEMKIDGIGGAGLPLLAPGKHEIEIIVKNRGGKSCALKGSITQTGKVAGSAGELDCLSIEMASASVLSTGVCVKAVRSAMKGLSRIEVDGKIMDFFICTNGSKEVELLLSPGQIGNKAERIRSGGSVLPGYFVRGPATASAEGFRLTVPPGVLARFNPEGGSVTVDAAPGGLRPLVGLSCSGTAGKGDALYCGNGDKFFFGHIGGKEKGIYKARKYEVAKDVSPPAWGKPSLTKIANLGEPELKIALKDAMSGIDPRSIVVFIDSKKVYPDWDSDASTVRIDVLGLSKGEHTVSGSARDRMGNRADLPLTRFFI